MTDIVEFEDLSPREVADPEEDAWLDRLATRLADNDHVLRLTGRGRDDDEDESALTRGPDGRWWAGRFIGEIRFEGRELRIAPRLGIDVVGAWLAYALNLTVVPKAATRAGGGPLIAQLVDRMWSAALADAARHGPPRFRREERHAGPYVRGRLDVERTIRHRARREPLVASVRQVRSLHNPVSRVLVLADRTLRSLVTPPRTWRPDLAEEVLGQLQGGVGASPSLPSHHELRRVRYTPITRRFEPVARLSYEVARRRGALTSAAGQDTSGVLIDVADLWELFLVHCARRAFGHSRVEHGTAMTATAYLLQAERDPSRQLGRLKPDMLIRSPLQEPLVVVDAKYKRLRDSRERPQGVARGDLYQLSAYLAGHSVPHGALAYPPHPEDQATADRFGPWRMQSGQLVEFIRLPSDERDCIAAMSRLVSHGRAASADRSPQQAGQSDYDQRAEAVVQFRE